MSSLTIPSTTIGSAFALAKTDWFCPGKEKLRLDTVTWLESPTKQIPQLIRDIAKNVGTHVQRAVALTDIIEDKNGDRMDRSKLFLALPLEALEIWVQSKALYQKRLHDKSSSGCADSKLMYGQYRGNTYKPGLISIFDGDKFMAFAAYYMAFGGMRAVRDVQRRLDWSVDKIRDVLFTAINASHQLLKKIGKRGIAWLNRVASAGMGFFQMFFAIVQDRSSVLTMAMMAAKKVVKKAANTATGDEGEIDVVDDSEDEATDSVTDGIARSTGNPNDGDDDGHENMDEDNATHVAADGPPPRSPNDTVDDPNAPDDPDNPEIHDPDARLKMGRELAYEMLRQSRNKPKTSQRHRLLMDSVDDRILLNAMQKDLRPTDLAVAERMTNFLSYCWQWAERTGIFREPDHQKKLDMPIAQVIRQIISAVQMGYWEVGDNKLADNGKIWINVTHEDRNGRIRVTALTRPISMHLKTKPHPDGVKGRMMITNPDHPALREYFFRHLPNRKTWPSEKNTRYFIVLNEENETITAQRFFHPRGNALAGARSIDDLEDGGQWQSADTDAAVFDFADEDEATIQMVADATGIDKDVIRRSMDGDDRVHVIFVHACRAVSEDRNAMIEATFSQGKKETEIGDAAEVPPSLLNQNTRRDLARLLNLDLGTLEKAFQDDSDSTRALKRAIKNMPEHLRNQAIQKIHRAARH